MINTLTKYADLPARAALSAVFIIAGIGKINAFEGTQGYMEAFGLPGFLLAPTIAFEILVGLALLVGFKTRYVALILAGFTVVTALVFHRQFGDQMQQVLFLKNIAIAGGLLLLAKTGAPALSFEKPPKALNA
jgi:putative oxidoreductase